MRKQGFSSLSIPSEKRSMAPALRFFVTNIFILASIFFSSSSSAEIEGTLFTTPYEREYLDAARDEFLAQQAAKGFDIVDSPPPIINAEEEEIETVMYKLGGIVTRRDGSHEIWLNNRLIREAELPSIMTLAIVDGSTGLQINYEGAVYFIKTGQTLNATAGQILDSYLVNNVVEQGPAFDASTEESDVSSSEETTNLTENIEPPVVNENTSSASQISSLREAFLNGEINIEELESQIESLVTNLSEAQESINSSAPQNN